MFQKRLVLFMHKKKILIDRYIENDYFNDIDEENIRKITDEIAKDIYNEIKTYIGKYDASGLTSQTCPFCIERRIHVYNASKGYTVNITADELCSQCPYAQIHGECSEYNSVFKQMCKSLYYKNISQIKCITNEEYKQLIVEIEKQIPERS